jgi:hypothetical protein
MPDDEHKWANLEEQLYKAISSMMVDGGKGGTPSLGVLVGIFRTPGGLPEAAKARAKEIESLVEGSSYDARSLKKDTRIELADRLVALLRFVCHRGDWP